MKTTHKKIYAEMEGKYYVYTQKLNDEVIYVGKGSGSRRYFYNEVNDG